MEHYRNMLTNSALALLMVVFLGSCKGSRAVVGGEVDPGMSARQLIGNHYANQSEFKTLSGRIKIDYTQGDTSQGFNVSLRMDRDKVIWLSGPMGMAKALITPDRVSFYNKLHSEYFEGDFGYLSQLLGTDLDFEKVQNILLGNALTDLRQDRYRMEVVGNRYELKPRNASALIKILFQLEPKNFKIATQSIAQPLAGRALQASYTYQDILGRSLPQQIDILAGDQGKTSHIELEFRGLELDRTLNFPYQVPKGYDKITLK